jgi:hypothetical protein
MTATTTWLKTRALSRKYDEGKFREGTQRKLGVATLLRYETPQTLDSLVEELNSPTYWATVRRKDRNGNPFAGFMVHSEGSRCPRLYSISPKRA